MTAGDADPRPSRFGARLRITIFLTTVAGVLAVALAYALFDFNLYRDATVRKIQTVAEVLAENALAAVVFDDEIAAASALNSLRRETDIDAAVIYRRNGQPMQSYERISGAVGRAVAEDETWLAAQIAGLPTDPVWRLETDNVDVLVPMLLDGAPAGYLFVEASFRAFIEHIRRGAGYLILVVSVVLAIAWFLSRHLQRRLSGPLFELLRAARWVGRTQDFAVRIKRPSSDEIGDLVDSFNEMLHQVGERDAELQRYRYELEDRVQDRTRELVLAKDAAEAASRAKSDFLAAMSHEIRTPMNGVLGMTELLLGSNLNERQQRLAETAYRSGESLLAVINNVLDFSKIEAGRLELAVEPFDLRNVIEESVELVAEQAYAKRLTLVADIAVDLPQTVRGDAVRLRQVLINLLGNAVKFTERGEVRLTVRHGDVGDGESRFAFAVRDTGIGIPADSLVTIYEPFAQADRSTTRRFGGTGLGLAITHQLVEMMDGQIDIRSTPGEGTEVRFELLLPVLPLAETASFEELRSRRVLIVDDSAANREIVHNQILAWGMSNGSVGSATEALDMLRKAAARNEPYHAVLLDGQLPDMDGLSAGQEIRADPLIPPVAVIMLTSAGLDVDPEASQAAGINRHLSKPVRQAELLKALRDTVRPPPAARSTAVPGPSAGVEGRQRFAARVLLAEDNRVNQEVAMAMLQLLGCRADLVTDGTEAVAAVQGADYDLLLMDCHMPQMDGFAASRAIRDLERRRATGRSVPIIALTADVQKGIEARCNEAGMNGYLSKPYTERQLATVLERWLPARTVEPVQHSGPSAVVAVAAVLDAETVHSLIATGEALGQDLFGRMATVYRVEAQQLFGRMQTAARSDEAEGLRLAAHSLKSSSRNVGAAALAAVCASIEDAARERHLDELPGMLHEVGVQLPAVLEALAPFAVRAQAAPARRARTDDGDTPGVLVVDDDPVYRKTTKDVLTADGFRIATADSGPSALTYLRHETPRVILLDAMMPGMDGFETCRRIRALPQFARVPILMITGLDEAWSVDRSFVAGATDFATKPVNYAVLAQRLRFMLRAASQESELRERQMQLTTAQRMARLGYWRWDVASDHFELSEQLQRMCHLAAGNFGGTIDAYLALVHPDDRALVRSHIEMALRRPTTGAIDYRLSPRPGLHLRVQQELGTRSGADDVQTIIGTVQDVSKQRAAEEQIRKLAYYDGLTGLASRTHLAQHFNDQIRAAQRRGESFSVLLVDLDGFKDVNDSLGHDLGDELLSTVARRLQGVVREMDFVARLGGDEFCILLGNDEVGSELDAGSVASRCLSAVSEPVDLQGVQVRPQASIGIAQYPDDGKNTSDLLKAADSAMYAAKRAGKHRYTFYQPDMTAEVERRLKMEQAVRSALHNGEFRVHYQPQVDLRDGRIVGVEVLAFWQHPIDGVIPPVEFISILERIGLIGELGSWVLQTACREAVRWQRQGMAPLRIAVNVSPLQFTSEALQHAVAASIAETGIDAGQLEFEITESALHSDPGVVRGMRELKRLGVRIAIDDFGTGYSSLGSLKHLPIDTLKVDRLFIQGILDNVEDSVLLGTITGLAHTLGYQVVCEGIEQHEQALVLSGLGCDLGQGFLFSRPLPAAQIPSLLDGWVGAALVPSGRSIGRA